MKTAIGGLAVERAALAKERAALTQAATDVAGVAIDVGGRQRRRCPPSRRLPPKL